MDNRGETIAHEKALLALFQQMIDGWNQGDGQAYAAPFTEDADYVIIDGRLSKGREAIALGHQYIFDTFYKGSTMEGQVKNIRFLSPDIALLHAGGVLHLLSQAGVASEHPSTMTIIAVRQRDGWGFTAFQNTRIVERHQRQEG